MDFTIFRNGLYDIQVWLEKARKIEAARFEKTGPWEMTQNDLLELLDGYEKAQASLGTIGNFIFKAKKELK